MIRECLDLALQAPTPGDAQNWHFVVVTTAAQRAALAALYCKGAASMEYYAKQEIVAAATEQEAAKIARRFDSARYLADHLHEVPVHVIPCIQGRTEHLSRTEQAVLWGAILPAA